MERKIEAMHRIYGVHFGKRCENCPHLVKSTWDKTYYKCLLYGESHSEATDWRLKWQACGMIDNKVPVNHKPIIDTIRYDRSAHEAEKEPQIPGQVTMEELMQGVRA